MQNEILKSIIEKKKGNRYDVAVMYSGGKDSAYLIHLLRDIYNLRVVAVCVDNGFEYENHEETIKCYTDKLSVDLVVIRPSQKEFATFFNTVITESEYFAREGVNHVCFICNNILWCCVAKYAAENDIPYVASGLSLMQLSSGRPYPLKPDKMANAIAERSTKQILRNAIDGFIKCDRYKNDDGFKGFIDGLSESVNKVTTIYPYIYHQISVEDMKKTLDKYGWTPPNHADPKEYISSGCRIMSTVIGELEKLGLIVLNEREQAKAMINAGLIDNSDMEFANYDASKDIVNLSSPIINSIGIKEYLIEKCKENNREYVD